MSFITTGFREMGLKVRRQKTRIALRHEKRVLQKCEIALGREGVAEAASFPEVRNEIVALKKIEQEQKEVALRIAHLEEGLKAIETQRQENAKEQGAALAALEEQKKPLVQQRNEAQAAAELCERELAGVERRLHENEAADGELLRGLTALQAQTPPPADLDAQSAALRSQRAQLPGQRAELTRARQGSADAARAAKEKLGTGQAQVDEMDKKIADRRSEFEAHDRVLHERSRAQQEALKEARTHHQTVEERKNPAYLNIGRHLASQKIAPPNAPHLLEDVNHRRAAVERHSQHKETLAVLSRQIDKQELRKFYFSVSSVLILLAIILPLAMKSPAKREWLPSDTEAILSLNIQKLGRDDLPGRWEKDHPEEWRAVWSGLLASAQLTPALNLGRDAVRVTRALTSSGSGAAREFVLVQAKGDVAPVIRAVESGSEFEHRAVNGLPVWLRSDFALARVGPVTLAVGTPGEVDELVRVRLGIKQDLKITGHLFDRFQALDQETALRLISNDPPSLERFFPPVFARELLEAAQILGLGLTLKNPVNGRLILQMKSAEAAAQMAQQIRAEPARWLRLADSDLLLYAQAPEVVSLEADVEVRCLVPENSARLLLQRIAKTKAPPAIVGN